MQVELREAVRLLETRETALAQKREWATQMYAGVLCGEYSDDDRVATLIEAANELGYSAADVKFDVGIAEALWNGEMEIAELEEKIAASRQRMSQIDEEFGKGPADQAVAGRLRAEFSRLKRQIARAEELISIGTFTLRHTATNNQRVFVGRERALQPAVRAWRNQQAAATNGTQERSVDSSPAVEMQAPQSDLELAEHHFPVGSVEV